MQLSGTDVKVYAVFKETWTLIPSFIKPFTHCVMLKVFVFK